MNLVSFLISTGINLIYVPFLENGQSENVALEGGRSLEGPSSFPFNLLRNGPACNTTRLTLGASQLKFSTIPRGYCTNCCQIKPYRDIKFVLYNNKNYQMKGVRIVPFDKSGSLKRAGLNPDWNTVIFIHGFTELSPGQSGKAIVDAYLSRTENYNVILVDWGELAAFPWYRTAVQNVKLVGRVLGNFIRLFNLSGELPIDRLHVIGFSLGSHVASVAGKRLAENGLRIPRITALDPAFPEFSLDDRTKRLSETDAHYIDVIHTDAGIFGFPLSIGHADFYPNGGRALQPGCQPSYFSQQRLTDRVVACSHLRAWQLYAESVKNENAFPATECQKWRGSNKECNFTVDAFMGFSNKNSVGQFYLRTASKSPYSLNFNQQI